MKIINLITLIVFSLSLANFSYAKSSQDDFDDEFDAYEAEFSKNNQKEIYDPFEKINRKIFAFNNTLDIYLIEPLAKVYRDYTPKIIRKSLHNFTNNLTLPFSALNSFAQGKTENALATSSNFLINSTVGVLGFVDVAGDKNIRYEREDLGQTLGHYGVGAGPYLMIPILGPSTGRDFSGFAVEKAVDPLSFNALEFGGSHDAINLNFILLNGFVYNLDLRESLIDPIDEVRKDSFDLYATFRSVYIQQRDLKIKK